MVRFFLLSLMLLFGVFSGRALNVTVAHNLFYNVNNGPEKVVPVLEIYWQVNQKTLHFVTNEKKEIEGRIKTDITVFVDGTLVNDEHYVLKTTPQKDVSGLETLSIIDLKKYGVSVGLTKFTIRLTDFNDSTNTFVFSDSVRVKNHKDEPFFSDVQLLDTIISSELSTPFLKNGRQNIPLCADFLDDYKRQLHYYVELYRANSVANGRRPLVRRIRIGKEPNSAYLAGYEHIDTIQRDYIISASGSFSIGALKSGNYYLIATIEDKVGTVLASSRRFFQRLNMNPDEPTVENISMTEVFQDSVMENVTVLDLDKTFMSKFTLAQVRAILKMLLPVSDPMETNTIKGFLKKPNEMYMRYYIYNHFNAINAKDPAKAWKEYSKEVLEVNKRYSSQGVAGYETDRGFIYLRYGPPTDVIAVANEQGSLPYEVWQYNTLTQFSNKMELANALFLFYKPARAMSDYRLLHSTVYGEVRNLSWRNFLYSNSGSMSSNGLNENARAEQYIGDR